MNVFVSSNPLLALGLSSVAQADPINLPDPGTVGPYRVVFVTDTGALPAFPSDIATLNTYAIDAANSNPELVALATTWSAMAATTTTTVWENTGTNPTTDPSLPIYRLDGVLVSDGYTTFWDGAIDNAISRDENNDAPGGGSQTKTGFDDLGATVAGEEMDSATPILGYWDSTGNWAGIDSYEGNNNHMYVISGVIGGAQIPEPSSAVMLVLGGVGLIARRRRKV